MTILEALNAALQEALEQDERVLLIGEDVLDPYGGAFKVAQGLSTRFPDRVLTTPISELAITGIASGLALRGFRPVVEIMFGDFLGLACDQLLNHAAKYRWMYNNQVRVPMVVRTPMGGYRGYGPTHSQSIEKLFLGIPGLRVGALHAFTDVRRLLLDCIFRSEDPTLFIEHKLLYRVPLKTEDQPIDFEVTPGPTPFDPVTIRVAGAPPAAITVATYGYMSELVVEAIRRLAFEEEIFAEAVISAMLYPMNVDTVTGLSRVSGRLVTVEEGPAVAGWGAEVASAVWERCSTGKPEVFRRVGAAERPIPSSKPLETSALPTIEQICTIIKDAAATPVSPRRPHAYDDKNLSPAAQR
jgi:pyruvate/2-oxoglutarate/acetoin dehydrogenase E1 component